MRRALSQLIDMHDSFNHCITFWVVARLFLCFTDEETEVQGLTALNSSHCVMLFYRLVWKLFIFYTFRNLKLISTPFVVVNKSANSSIDLPRKETADNWILWLQPKIGQIYLFPFQVLSNYIQTRQNDSKQWSILALNCELLGYYLVNDFNMLVVKSVTKLGSHCSLRIRGVWIPGKQFLVRSEKSSRGY